jgi:FtsH-binding integral membrane protein
MNFLFGSGKNSKNVFQLILQKKEFLVLVFLNLLLQLGITYKTAEYTTDKEKYNFWLLVIATFVIITVLQFPIHPIIKFLLFSLFSYIFGLLLSVVKEKHNEREIRIAIENTLAVFASMFITAVALLIGGVKLGYKFGMFLFFSLLGLIIFRIVQLFSGFNYNSFLNIFGIILFSLYILYHTNTILQKDYQGDFINASMSYYLDVLNLFQNLLNSES